MKTMDTLDALLLEEMREMYHAEGQLLRAMPRMERSATSSHLRRALKQQGEETKRQRDRLEVVFAILSQPPRGETCEAMAGLIRESDDLLLADADPAVKDAGIICAAQKIGHYQIASYGCVCTYAKLLGLDEIANVLTESLEEEKHADQVLTQLARNEINVAAMAESVC